MPLINITDEQYTNIELVLDLERQRSRQAQCKIPKDSELYNRHEAWIANITGTLVALAAGFDHHKPFPGDRGIQFEPIESKQKDA